MSNYNQLASRINQHVQMLESQGVTDPQVLFNQMMGYMPELNGLWNNTSDAEFFALSEQYPYFKQYCVIVENLYQQEQMRPDKPYQELEKFNDKQKVLVSEVLTIAAEIEKIILEFTTGQHSATEKDIENIESQYHQWVAAKQKLIQQLKHDGVEDLAIEYVENALDPVEVRLDEILDDLKSDYDANESNNGSIFHYLTDEKDIEDFERYVGTDMEDLLVSGSRTFRRLERYLDESEFYKIRIILTALVRDFGYPNVRYTTVLAITIYESTAAVTENSTSRNRDIVSVELALARKHLMEDELEDYTKAIGLVKDRWPEYLSNPSGFKL